MKLRFLFISLVFNSLLSCKKDTELIVTGTVDVKAGCFSDAWLFAIDNPNPEKHLFLRNANFPSATLYNCSNAVFIRLPSSFAATGTRIRFSYLDTEVSCLSSSEAPSHIKVKNLFRL